jgi:hypothetical protein
MIYFGIDCLEGETDFATIATDTVKQIDEKIAPGLWQGEPYSACGSVVVTVAAVSEAAAAQISDRICNSNSTGGIEVVIDGEVYPGLCANPPTTTTTTTSTTTILNVDAAASKTNGGATAGIIVALLLLLMLVIVGTVWYTRRQDIQDANLFAKSLDDDAEEAGAVSFSFVRGAASPSTRRDSSTDEMDSDPTYGSLAFHDGGTMANLDEDAYADIGPNAPMGGENNYLDTAPNADGSTGYAGGGNEASYLDTAPNAADYRDTTGAAEQADQEYMDTHPTEHPSEPTYAAAGSGGGGGVMYDTAAYDGAGDEGTYAMASDVLGGGATYDTAAYYGGAGDEGTYAMASGQAPANQEAMYQVTGQSAEHNEEMQMREMHAAISGTIHVVVCVWGVGVVRGGVVRCAKGVDCCLQIEDAMADPQFTQSPLFWR